MGGYRCWQQSVSDQQTTHNDPRNACRLLQIDSSQFRSTRSKPFFIQATKTACCGSWLIQRKRLGLFTSIFALCRCYRFFQSTRATGHSTNGRQSAPSLISVRPRLTEWSWHQLGCDDAAALSTQLFDCSRRPNDCNYRHHSRYCTDDDDDAVFPAVDAAAAATELRRLFLRLLLTNADRVLLPQSLCRHPH